ncbi:hypothetical protein GINT2_001321 [Glugoides intestinalis]
MQKLSNLIIDNSIQSPRALDELRKELAQTTTQMKAMKTVVSMLQQNYEMATLLSDVLKIIDTSNYELKVLCNFYLRVICSNKPACLLMCTNTFFKDFNDNNSKIQQLAIIDSVELSDEILIKNYIRDINRMCHHTNANVRALVPRCLSMIYLKNNKLFHDENLLKVTRDLLYDTKNGVKAATLRAINIIDQKENFFSAKEIVTITNEFLRTGNSTGIRPALSILKHKKMTMEMKDLLLKTLRSNDICIFYHSAARLLEDCDEVCVQEIYELAIGFLNVRVEQQHNLLLFIRTFVDKIQINVNDFILFETDPNSIKIAKMAILIRKYTQLDDISKEIVLERTLGVFCDQDPEIYRSLLVFFIRNGDYSSGLFKLFVSKHNNEDIFITAIDENKEYIKNSVWKAAISEVLLNVKKTANADRFIRLVSNFCDKVPKLVLKLVDEAKSMTECLILVKMLVQLMHKEVIGEVQCANYLKIMLKKHPKVHRIKMILNNLRTVDSEDIFRDDFKTFDIEPGKQVKECLPAVVTTASIPFFVDSLDCKGVINIENNKFILVVDIIEQVELLKLQIDTIEHTEQITTEGRYVLFEITEEFVGKEYLIEIAGQSLKGIVQKQENK